MSDRKDVENGLLVYTCNCGWVDKNHAVKTSSRPNIGAKNLWEQISKEKGTTSKFRGANGFQVVYTQDMGKVVKGVALTTGVTGKYFVRGGLSIADKESVALAIFMEVSHQFEDYQGWFFWSNSSFSMEDLVSDLLSFYGVVRPGTDYIQLCEPVSTKGSLAMWDMYGPVGKIKNPQFKPILLSCDECQKPLEFPKALQAIKPADKGTLFRDWIREDDVGTAQIEQEEIRRKELNQRNWDKR